jgi:DNA processing protein
MTAADLRLCLLLHSLHQTLSDTDLCRLLLHYGSPEALWQAGYGDWCAQGLHPSAAGALRQLREHPASAPFDVDAQAARLQQLGASIVPICDARYPALLHTIHDPPPLLYCRGVVEALQRPLLAVVGSRRASSAGLRAAGELSAAASEAGLGLCSGLALGIDGAAHRGALRVGGAEVAVMATGIDLVYPRRHADLARQLLQDGCLVTEFAPGVSPLKQNFPRRNRIISGLSLGVLVVEAALPSGSLITAGAALEQGREVFALPWSPFHQGGAGCLQLLRDGAVMVERIDDILAALGPMYRTQRELSRPGASAGALPTGLSAGESRLLELLGFEVIDVDRLVIDSRLPVAQVLADLSQLELAGLVEQRDGGYLRR